MIRTLHVPIYRNGSVIHRATVRSDWTDQEYIELAKTFGDGCTFKSRSTSMPCDLLIRHDLGLRQQPYFKSMKKYAWERQIRH